MSHGTPLNTTTLHHNSCTQPSSLPSNYAAYRFPQFDSRFSHTATRTQYHLEATLCTNLLACPMHHPSDKGVTRSLSLSPHSSPTDTHPSEKTADRPPQPDQCLDMQPPHQSLIPPLTLRATRTNRDRQLTS